MVDNLEWHAIMCLPSNRKVKWDQVADRLAGADP